MDALWAATGCIAANGMWSRTGGDAAEAIAVEAWFVHARRLARTVPVMHRWLRVSRGVGLLSITVICSACVGSPSPPVPRSPAAARIAELGWLLTALAAAVCLVVLVALVASLIVARRRRETASRTPEGRN